MSRFLKERHYRLVLPGIKAIIELHNNFNLRVATYKYMDLTAVSYTEEDADYIMKLYQERYGAVPKEK